MASRHSLSDSSVVPFRFVFLMWLVFSVEFFMNIDLGYLGVKPRTWEGLAGILMAPLLHASLVHLFSNTFPMLFLGWVLYYFFPRIANKVFFSCYFITGALVWLLSPRQSYHIGASGLVYGLTAFLILFGILRGEFKSVFISVVVFLAYGSIFYGIFPSDPRVSWESHLAGALVGVGTAIQINRKSGSYG